MNSAPVIHLENNPFKYKKPEFGNEVHIAYIKKFNQVFSGEINFHEIDWKSGRYVSRQHIIPTTKKGSVDCFYEYVPCPRCKRFHKLIVSFSPDNYLNSSSWYDTLIEIDQTVENFCCWNCDLEFIVENRLVYVKKGQKGWI